MELLCMRLSLTQRKILLLLLGGTALGLSGNPKRYFKILKALSQEWNELGQQTLKRNALKLQKSKLLFVEKSQQGDYSLKLTDQGKEWAKQCSLENMAIKKEKKWDQTWRVIISDIPEGRKKTRERFRFLLKNLGFFPLQKSVYVHAFHCLEEIEMIVETLFLKKYVKIILSHYIDNDRKIRDFFGLD